MKSRNVTYCFRIYQFEASSSTLLEIGAVLDEGKSIYLCGLGIEKNVLLL